MERIYAAALAGRVGNACTTPIRIANCRRRPLLTSMRHNPLLAKLPYASANPRMGG
jgi:hypothetical protein